MRSQHVEWPERYGPWAVVTGASDGIGKAMAVCLTEAGLNIVLVARRRPLLERLADNLTGRFNIETRIVDADLSTLAGVEQVIEATRSLEVGLLVAGAGFGTGGSFIQLPLERELNMLDVNCRAALALTHHFGQRFAQQKHGGIVLMSSLLAFQGVPLSAHYAATKAYMQTLAEGLHHELAPLGVDVLASAPGPVNSGFAARADMRMSIALRPDIVAKSTLNALGHTTTVQPGWLSKILIGSLGLMPRGWRVRVMGQIMKGMTQHQNH